MERTVLVSGASIAGLSAAYWLNRAGWAVTVIERAPAFRGGGQNVDVRAEAREVVRLMGIEPAIAAATTTEEGAVFVNERGADVARFPMRPDGEGLTAGLEILRGDLARILLEALPGDVEVRFGESIESVSTGAGVEGVQADETTGSDRPTQPTPDERATAAERAEVTFASGERSTYDLVVIAEGVRSTTRDLVFGSEVQQDELGLSMVYGTIPRRNDDDRWWHWYAAPGGRQVTMRPDDHGTRRATLSYRTAHGGLAGLPQDRLVARLRELFGDAGWESQRVLDGFAGSDDVYADDLTQIRMPSWSRGRVCAVGDAAWCVTPLGGGGCSLALVGGYVLGAALSRHCHGETPASEQVRAALAEYEAWLRPDVKEVQGLPPGIVAASHPRSRAGVRLQRGALRVGANPLVRRVMQRYGGDTLRPLPEGEFVH